MDPLKARLYGALIQLPVVLLLPPLLPGLIARVKAIVAGRRGPPLLQLYYDLAKLWQKQAVLSSTTTVMFRLGPVVAVLTALVASMLIPMGGDAPGAFSGDLILIAYLLALGRFFTISAALDTGSAFEGMGASREATFSCLAEPALFIGFAGLVRLSGQGPSLSLALAHAEPWAREAGSLLLILGAWLIVFLAENSRVPFDDPNTHLELTMVHEVMVLDHGGPPLALVLYGASLKLLVLGALIVRIFLPPIFGHLALGWLQFIGGIVILMVVVGLVESLMARLRLLHAPQLLVGANLLAVLGAGLLLR